MIKAIITGVTGMVGEGVLLECLRSPEVEQVLIISRKPSGFTHEKLREIVHADFYDLSSIEAELRGYDACFFCLGTSSVGMSKEEYKRVTYDLTMQMGQTLAKLNPDTAFCYVTGAGTDSTEQGGSAWARVKGATENALLALFPRAYMFRPAIMKASPGQKNLKTAYKMLAWVYPIGHALAPSYFCTLEEVGKAMINVATKGHGKRVLAVKDIVELSKL